MNHFGDFAKKEDAGLDGKKIPISNLFGRLIIVNAYRKLESRAVKGKTCVQIQVILDGEVYVTFTNSTVIERQLDDYQTMIPFDAKIEKRHNYYTFVAGGNETKEEIK